MTRRTWPKEAAYPLVHVVKTLPIFLMTLSIACGSDDTTAPAAEASTVAQVVVTPNSAELDLKGDTVQLMATARDDNGNVISGKTFTWTSSAAAVAPVTSAGVVTAVENGTAAIRATVDGVSGEIAVTVSEIAQGDLEGGVEVFVIAAVGETLTTANGIMAIIPADALPGDTTVKIVPVEAEDDLGRRIVAVRFEPEGLILNRPFVVSFPLPAGWSEEDTPLVMEFKGDDADGAVLTEAYARVVGEPGAFRAEMLLSHFSGGVCAHNCHAGTIQQVLRQLEARGCSADSARAKIRSQFGIDIPAADQCGARGVENVQALLDTYFDDFGGFNAGEDLSPQSMETLAQMVRDGRQVVLAFKAGEWGSRNQANNNFYPTAATEYAHTAVLVLHEGEVQIRNTLATKDRQLMQALAQPGEELGNVVWYPFNSSGTARSVNTFRNLPQGVAAELQLCGEPDCLSDTSRNPWEINSYRPVAGQSYVGRAWSDPWTYILSEGDWSGIPPRSIPWTAVRVYVAKNIGPLDTSCDPVSASVEGSVVNAATSDPLEGATVTAVRGGEQKGSASTGSDGRYRLALEAGQYDLVAAKDGFISVTYNGANAPESGSTTIETIPLVPDGQGSGGVAGTVTNARDGVPIAGATVEVRGGMNAPDGPVAVSTVTDAGGAYTVTVPEPGTYTLVVQATGFVTGVRTGIVIAAQNVVGQDLALSPEGAENEVRIVLSWGQSPSDLDSHLTGPLEAGGRFHVYFSSRGSLTGPPGAHLDRDDTSSFGPETVTIVQQESGVYRYSVHDYTNRTSTDSSALSGSGAKVEVFIGAEFVDRFFVPGGGGTLWTVFEMDNGVISRIDGMSFESLSGAVQTPARTDAAAIGAATATVKKN